MARTWAPVERGDVVFGGLTTDSLIAPLDLVRFTLAYALLVFVPGYALATLLRSMSPRSERAALAIPCGYTLVAITGLATALLKLPFNLLSYAALALPVTVASAYVAWRAPIEPADEHVGRWWLAPVSVAVVQLCAIALIFAGDVMPSGSDTVSHVTWTGLIARSHIFPIALNSSRIGANDGGFYPPVFHAVTALVLGAAPMPVYRAVFFSVVAVIALLPMGLFSYVRTATGSARLGGLAALASLAFEPLPFFVLAQGLYTLTAAMIFIPGLALVLRDALGLGQRRSVALAGLLGIGLFYTHPTEFVTVALLAIAITTGLLREVRLVARALGYGVLVAGVWFVAAFPALRAVRQTIVAGAGTEIQVTHDFARQAQVQLGPVLTAYVQWVYGNNVSFLLLIAVIAGAAWCIARRRYLGLVVVQAALFLLVVDANSYSILHRFYVLSFPWALWERLAATHYWFVLPLAAVGIDAVVRGFERPARARAPFYVAIATLPFALLGLVVPAGIATARAAAYSNARKVVAPADLGALAWLAQHAPAGSVVVDDENMSMVSTFDAPIDAGLWIPALSQSQPLFWRSGIGPGSLDDRLYLLAHVADIHLTARAADLISLLHVRYVFYGAGIRPDSRHHLNLTRLLANPHLRLAYASAATCRGARTNSPMACSASASYVFDVIGPAHVIGIAKAGHDQLSSR